MESVKAAEVKTDIVTRASTTESFRCNIAPGYQQIGTVINRGNSDLRIWLTEAGSNSIMFILGDGSGSLYMGNKTSVTVGNSGIISFPSGNTTYTLYAYNPLSSWQTIAGSYEY